VAAAALAPLLAALFINAIAAAAGSPGTISFTQATYDVGEAVGKANITLTRTGGSDGAVLAKVSLTDVTTSPADHQFRPGSIDPTFANVFPPPNFYDQQTIAMQPDGKVIVGGSGTPLMQRLKTDGTPDTTFAPYPFNAPIEAIAVQPDGKIVVSGTFTGIPGMIRIARLNPNGSLDTTFNACAGLNDSAKTIVIQSDGKIVIAGFFNTVNFTPRQSLARLNPDGSLDASYHPSISSCYRLALQEDGKLLAAGSSGVGIVRFNTDGTPDAGFQGSSFFAGVMLPQPGGKLYIGGGRIQNGTVTDRGVYLLNSDGSLDPSFDTGAGTNPEGGVAGLVVEPDGKLIAGGNFTTYRGVATGPLVRLNPDGSVDPSFQAPQFLINDPPNRPYFLTLLGQPDGKFIAIGDFVVTIPGGYRSNIARFNADLFVNWAAGDAANKSFSIPVVEELLDEPDETATLTLTPVAGGAATGAHPTATLQIIDNDVPPSFTSAPPARAIANVAYQHQFTANGEPTVFFSVTSGALPPGLTLSSTGFLTGTPTTTGTFANITVTANNGVAPTATQTFDLVVASGGTLQFESAAYSVNENVNSHTVEITINRVGGSAGSASVTLAAFGNTATLNTDFALTATAFNFAEGETSRTLTVAIDNDAVNERDETATISLTSATGTARLGTPSSTVLTIVNDDPLPAISVNNTTVTEGDSGTKAATFTITRVGLIDRTLTFAARTSDGTAVAGEDYIAIGGQGQSFQIGPASTSTTVSVNILGDTYIEPDKNFFLDLSSPSNATIERARGACEIKDNDTLTGVPTVQFVVRDLRVQEGVGVAAVTVTRSGDTSAPTNVNYTSMLGSGAGAANDRGDFTFAAGTLRFNAGETSKTFNIFVADDAFVEGEEYFTLVLGAPTGGTSLGVPSSTVVHLLDNDAAPSASNPADDAAFFVRQHYRDFLGRDPDADGLAFWTGEITQCGANAVCREVKRVNVSAAFFLSIEFKETGYFVYLLHKAAFNTGERLPLRNFQSDAQQVGRDAVVGSDGWEQKLAANKQAFADAFVARTAFAAAYPQALTAAQFVDALLANTGDPLNPAAGGALSQAERDQLISDLASGAKTRAQVLRALAENDEYRRRQLSRAFVLMQYFGYLRRAPNELPDASFDGYNFWLSKLNEFRGNYIEAEMVKAFISSDEYRRRFGQ
jgi:uncharacterized delta-60 repeat protein